MNIKDQFKTIEAEDAALYLEDTLGHKKIWQKMIHLLTQNEEQTILFLNDCTQDEVLTASEVFEEVSQQLQSRAFIDCLRQLDKKYPAANLTEFIDAAEMLVENASLD